MSVICWSIVQKIGAVLLEHDIKSVKLADGSCVEVKGSVVVHVEVPGYEGNSLGFEEECLVIEMVQSQHQLLVGKKTVIEQSLLEWTQEENTPIESKLEKSLNTEFVSFEADLDAEWTCGIP
ncbi:hypothetical protein ADUPG1_003809, partial [Aduncisulcus paluster]